jgi:hypothetical protein
MRALKGNIHYYISSGIGTGMSNTLSNSVYVLAKNVFNSEKVTIGEHIIVNQFHS